MRKYHQTPDEIAAMDARTDVLLRDMFPFEAQIEKAAQLEAQWRKANSGGGHSLFPSDFRFLFDYIHSLEKINKERLFWLKQIAAGNCINPVEFAKARITQI